MSIICTQTTITRWVGRLSTLPKNAKQAPDDDTASIQQRSTGLPLVKVERISGTEIGENLTIVCSQAITKVIISSNKNTRNPRWGLIRPLHENA